MAAAKDRVSSTGILQLTSETPNDAVMGGGGWRDVPVGKEPAFEP